MDAIAVLKNRRVFALLTILTTLILASVVVVLTAEYVGAATFKVNSAADRVDASVGDAVCKTSAGTCTLRAAIQVTNALSGPDTIRVPAGTYALAIQPQGGNGANTGGHDITGPLTIRGAGADSTILDAGRPAALRPRSAGSTGCLRSAPPQAMSPSQEGLGI